MTRPTGPGRRIAVAIAAIALLPWSSRASTPTFAGPGAGHATEHRAIELQAACGSEGQITLVRGRNSRSIRIDAAGLPPRSQWSGEILLMTANGPRTITFRRHANGGQWRLDRTTMSPIRHLSVDAWRGKREAGPTCGGEISTGALVEAAAHCPKPGFVLGTRVEARREHLRVATAAQPAPPGSRRTLATALRIDGAWHVKSASSAADRNGVIAAESRFGKGRLSRLRISIEKSDSIQCQMTVLLRR